MTYLPRTKRGGKRRTRHPMPDLTRQTFEEAMREENGAAVRMGPQAELCKQTMCCVCWVLYLRRNSSEQVAAATPGWAGWARLPSMGERVSIPHHEPQGRASDDDDTLPLCSQHHTGPSFVQRHPGTSGPFWDHYKVHWQSVRDEMRRRVKAEA